MTAGDARRRAERERLELEQLRAMQNTRARIRTVGRVLLIFGLLVAASYAGSSLAISCAVPS